MQKRMRGLGGLSPDGDLSSGPGLCLLRGTVGFGKWPGRGPAFAAAAATPEQEHVDESTVISGS